MRTWASPDRWTTSGAGRSPAEPSDVVIEDLRDVYLRDYVLPALRANAAYERRYLMAAPLGRPLIGRRLVAIARAEGADAVAHGSTGKGNDGVRFYAAVVAHDTSLRVLAPAAEWELTCRADELRYAQEHGIEVPVGVESPYSMDGSIWGTSTECGPIEDPGAPAPDDAWQLTRSVDDAPDAPADVVVTFERGIPVALDGSEHRPVELVRSLTELAGAHGVGRVDMVESSLLGIKTRALYESPAGTVLHLAHRELESLCLDRDTLRFKAAVDQRYAELVYDGLWFSVAATVAGSVRRRHAGAGLRDRRRAAAQGECDVPGAVVPVGAASVRRSPITTPATGLTTRRRLGSPMCGRCPNASTDCRSSATHPFPAGQSED